MPIVTPRDPGFFEEYHLVRHYLGLDNGVIVAAQYKHTTQSLSLDTLPSAILCVVSREQASRLGVTNVDTAHPKFVYCKVDEETLV